MTELSKRVIRSTSARRHEKSKHRIVILSLDPPCSVGVRLAGTRQTYRLEAESIYELAVRHHENQIDRRARAIKKENPFVKTMKSARAKARKELLAELKG